MATLDPPGVPRRFEYEAGASRKYWVVTRIGSVLLIHSGRMGTKGLWTTSPYATEQVAIATKRDRVREKLGKGYREVPALAADTVDIQTLRPAQGPSPYLSDEAMSLALGPGLRQATPPVYASPDRPRSRSRQTPAPVAPKHRPAAVPSDVVYDPLD